MCFHSLVSMTDKQLAKHFRVTLENMQALAPQFYVNAFNFPTTPVITNIKRNTLQHFRWGLIPHWAKNDEIKKYTLNAKIETLNDKPSFRDAAHQHCLIPSNGFYEWQWLDPKGVHKKKFLVKVKGQEVFAFAGIWSRWVNPQSGEMIFTYALLTTEANELMSIIHNSKKRMPVIVRPDEYNKWLDNEEINLDGNELEAEETR
ncbi:MAG TPA: SOS response-associated peptidase [Saprospiraceae bacterium]|nr:SOS response-associated peptidase [Saprospiraceae bacterium]HMX89431.1 SOS response-associated peptidase [Saprospiraceae bacterium]HMZ40048.1 SOS response-associated peptidase [Saprospiraceae bacterium]HNB31112.1 SOS response-associated peptidase [Saprospiraceae bacterium]HNC35432.1 SOS response-associated peptidase [Saprospiraceae bacterium]